MTPKHSDIILDIILQEDDLEDGTPGDRINYDDLAGCLILVYQANSQPLKQYSKNIPSPNPEGLLPITVTDGPEGEISIRIPRSLTKTMVPADFFIEVQIAEDDTDSEDDVFYTIATDIKIDLIKESVGNKKTIET